ncbi:MAG: LacI family DNA-binding transcriptional regulator, partial [Ignavibacteria bacterium]|nr:LacI family DNA-binding transcriptional regulator [Ignavibacteria bacterium]
VTLKDIAERMNVSTVTVSKALHGHPDISPETAMNIQALAQALGYIPNYFARSISSNYSKTIGIVVPIISDPFYSQIFEVMYHLAFEKGYEIILKVSRESAQRERKCIETLLSMRVDAIIVSITEETTDVSIFQSVKQFGVPLTFINRAIDEAGFNKVVVDEFAGAYEAADKVIKLGYKKIAHLSDYKHNVIAKSQLMGFEEALKQHNIPVRKELILSCGFTDKDGYESLLKLYAAKNLPDCIFCFSFPIAFGVYRAACEIGLKIPEDIEIISFGNSAMNQFLSPSLPYVVQPASELGLKAIELTLKNIINNDSFVPQTIKIPTHLVLRDSCGSFQKHTSQWNTVSANRVGVFV